ncbi:41310_t:CDS:1, partial [Gigaspora margarita]
MITSNLFAQSNIDNSNNPFKNHSLSVTTYLSRSKSISYNQYNCHSTYSLLITENITYNDELLDLS